jgi:putative ABC transport system permease protein
MSLVFLPILLLMALIIGCSLFDLVARRSLRRMALRNIARRPVEALLVVGGAALGTAIITSAFVAGDTFDASIRNIARTDLGPIDETVQIADLSQLDAVEAQLNDPAPIEGTDGVLPMVLAQTAVRAGDGDKAEPVVQIGEVDFDAARAFGGDTAATGLANAGPTPTPGEVVINDKLAKDLDVRTGDTIDVFAYGHTTELTVRTVLPQVGLAGFNQAYVAAGTLTDLAATPAVGAPGAEPPSGGLLISNNGGVFDSAERSDAVERALDDRLRGVQGLEISSIKQDLLDDAESSGAEMRDMFTALGTFSIAAGVLLLINLFVMLSEERKPELGMLRAVGMKRNNLVRLFGLEGGLYSVAAAGLGAVAGIGVGWAIVQAVQNILADEEDLHFVLRIEPASLIISGLVGLAISLLTVWGTSARIARLNVIRAIRDLPEPRTKRTSVWRLVFGALGMVIGGLVLQSGLSGDAAVPVLIGPGIALASAVPLFGRFLPRRAVVAVAGGVAAFWAVASIELVPDAFKDAGIEMFAVQGLLLVGAGVAVVAQGDRAWGWMADRLADRGGLASRLAVAYPLARRVRTAMLLAMFALITFMLTFMASISDANLAQAPALARDASAGWDLWVDSSATNPVTTDQLAQNDDVVATAPLVQGMAELTQGTAAASDNRSDNDKDKSETWPLTGFEPTFTAPGAPKLSHRLDRYADDEAAFAAVAADPNLAIGSDWLFEGNGPSSEGGLNVGDKVTATDPATGQSKVFTIAGLTDQDWADNGLLVGRNAATTLLGDRAVERRHLVQVTDGADAEAVADQIKADWVTSGAEATTFISAVEKDVHETEGFIRLLQGYLGLGLLIGIAGLGVVMVRAVRERRRQIGMLRAIGFSSRVVRRAFLAEAGFVSLQGIVLGMGLGLVTSYQMLRSDVFGDPLPFTIPWVALVVLFVVPAAAAFAAAGAPAAQAARIRPAAALRMGE